MRIQFAFKSAREFDSPSYPQACTQIQIRSLNARAFLIRILSFFYCMHSFFHSFLKIKIKNHFCFLSFFRLFADGPFFSKPTDSRFDFLSESKLTELTDRQTEKRQTATKTDRTDRQTEKQTTTATPATATTRNNNNHRQQKRVVQMELKGFCNQNPIPPPAQGSNLQSHSINPGRWERVLVTKIRGVINIHFMFKKIKRKSADLNFASPIPAREYINSLLNIFIIFVFSRI